ncbi:1295_t:CDS:2 [Gigaspora margarita]|uniref:1295_t:CDS:1 n=1 Tax=Gigaspora margarita TaxID=4874 RepID=A0ABN7V183_GIGMA|nr:1295_t:CDS:2 [Gigaspora margarita]
MAEVLELYYVPKILVKDGNKGSSSEGKNLKQEKRELDFETVRGSFINAYLEVLKNWILEVIRSEETKSKEKKKIEHINEESANINEFISQAKEFQVKKNEHEAFKNCERLTKIEIEMDEQTRDKDKHKALPCYKKTADEEPNTATNLEHACEERAKCE